MLCLASPIGYSTGEFQALQLIATVVFGALDEPFTSWILVHFFANLAWNDSGFVNFT